MGQAVNRIIGTLLGLPPGVASLPNARPAAAAGGGGGGGSYVPPLMSQPAPVPLPPLAPVIASLAPPAPAAAHTGAGMIAGRWIGLAECDQRSYPISLEVSGNSVVEMKVVYSDSAHNQKVDATLILVPGNSDQGARFAFRTREDRWIVMKNGHQLSLNEAGRLVTPSDALRQCKMIRSKV